MSGGGAGELHLIQPDTVSKRAVRILLECCLIGYASSAFIISQANGTRRIAMSMYCCGKLVENNRAFFIILI